jgi:predicted MPP superfamily phosphohydrolase
LLDRLRWLHIADLHVVATGDEFSQGVAITALIEDVRHHLAESPADFVIVSGDVAFSGKPSEYERASHYLNELAVAAGVSPRDFYFVPGNHDVDRDRSRLAFTGARAELAAEPDVDRLLGSAEDLRPLLDRQEAFWSFVETFAGNQERQPTPDGLGYVRTSVFDGVRVALVGLNSSWLCGTDEEEGKLLIGERQLIDAVNQANQSSPHLVIAIVHHPIAWLQEWDQVAVAHRLLPAAHLLHRGHLHMHEVSLTSSPEKPCLLVAAGSGHATRFYGNSYNITDLDLGGAACVVRSYKYDPTAGSYEEGASDTASIIVHGRVPGTSDELSDALATVASAAPYSAYLADLLVGALEEIPIKVGDEVIFRTLTFADAARADGLDQVRPFMRLRNLFRLYGDDVSLEDAVQDHVQAIAQVAKYLDDLGQQDNACAARLSDYRARPRSHAGPVKSAPSALEHTAALLADLRISGDWALLETLARRFASSADNDLARRANAALAEALMHSDETAKRVEAAALAAGLIEEPDAPPEAYVLAAGCAEVMSDDDSAVSIVIRALTAWPANADVRVYARQLALRTGNQRLRARLEAPQHHGASS